MNHPAPDKAKLPGQLPLWLIAVRVMLIAEKHVMASIATMLSTHAAMMHVAVASPPAPSEHAPVSEKLPNDVARRE